MKFIVTLCVIASIALGMIAACTPIPTATSVPASTLVPATPAATATPSGPTPTKAPPVTVVPTPGAQVSFQNEVLPIFKEFCLRCHGGTKPIQDMSLETYAGVMKGGLSGIVVKPRDPDGSIMIRYIQIDFMPFEIEPKLTKDQKQFIINWIAAGAPDN
ncbi:MAG: hypothetical protein HY327_11470 [Chloroflexi bacterium]|nr:hypothetical protein [Chloroflexota bacterium]